MFAAGEGYAAVWDMLSPEVSENDQRCLLPYIFIKYSSSIHQALSTSSGFVFGFGNFTAFFVAVLDAWFDCLGEFRLELSTQLVVSAGCFWNFNE